MKQIKIHHPVQFSPSRPAPRSLSSVFLLIIGLALGATSALSILTPSAAQAQTIFHDLYYNLGFGAEDPTEPPQRRRRTERPQEQLPIDRPRRIEQDRSKEQVNCSNLSKFVTKETVVVDGVRMTRPVVKNESYVRCLKQPRSPWIVKHTEWSPEHELGFQKFIERMGSSDCKTVDTCMASAKANPLISEEDIAAFHYSDCADFPVYLRAYYAYKNNLPFSYLSGVGQRKSEKEIAPVFGDDGRPKPTDYRYTPDGNLPHARTSVFVKGQTRCATNDFFTWSNCLVEVYHTGMARMSKWEPSSIQPVAPDYYSPRIDRGSIKPGTVVYNADGHIAIVYKVDLDGQIFLISASPGGHVGRSKMNRTWIIYGPKSGSGFKNWRPFKVVNPRYDKNGNITNGQFVFAKDEEIQDFSMEQYYGHKNLDRVLVDGKYSGDEVRFSIYGTEFKKIEFLRYVQARLMESGRRLNPVREFERSLGDICIEFQGRSELVKKAAAHGISAKRTPERYPENIFGSSGEWENYSTPSRDTRIRQMIYFLKNDLIYYAKTIQELAGRRDGILDYTGTNLKLDLQKALHRANFSCQLQYKASDGVIVELTLQDLISRAARMSFDPYQCVENRWGASTAAEQKSCSNDSEKNRWHRATQFLRNIYSRPSALKTGKTLPEFEAWVKGVSRVNVGNGESLPSADTSSEYDLLKAISEL